MSYLYEIRDFAQKLAEAIANSLEVQISIIDEGRVQVAGTSRYITSVGTQINAYGIMHQAMMNRQLYFVENPREERVCGKCTMRERCVETASVGYPIIMDNRVIGAIGINCFTNLEKERLMNKKDSLVLFLQGMAELLSAKIKEHINMKNITEQNNELKQILDCLTEGIIILDREGNIKNHNMNAKRMLSAHNRNISGIHINELVENLDISSLKKEGEDFLYYEINLKGAKKQYALFINSIKQDDEFFGATILIKNVDEVKKIIYMNNYGQINIGFDDIIGDADNFVKAKELARQVSTKDADVLITGESGTGKELFARAIHSTSIRCNGPFIPINCAAIPQELLESELFGYERGAFTGAGKHGKPGKFELANRGTLFLDEIGDMPFYLQAKLLRAVEERIIERVGGTNPIKVDIRIIAATNKDLQQMIKTNSFRKDLYYRLNIVPVNIPPLRNRKEDIPLLLDYYFIKYRKLFNISIEGIEENAMTSLVHYEWPGNVRELENLVQYLCCVYTSGNITNAMLQKRIDLSDPKGGGKKANKIIPLEQLEYNAILKAVEHFENTTEGKLKAAKALGIGKSTLYRKLKGK